MKRARNIYLIVTIVVACSYFAMGQGEALHRIKPAFGGLAEWKFSNIGLDWHNWSNVLYIIVFCIGAVGVIWLGLYGMKLIGAITSIAKQLSTEQQGDQADQGEALDRIKPAFGQLDRIRPNSVGIHFKSYSNVLIDQLGQAINDRLEVSAKIIEELQKQVQDLQINSQLSQKQKRNTEAIIYSLRDAVIVADEFDRLLMANEEAGKLFNFNIKTSQQKQISEIIDPSKSEFVNFLRQSRRTKTEAVKREMEIFKNGDLKTFDCIVSCVHDDDNRVCGVVAVLHDITREKEISQMKNDFVSHVSHELKTPLASITAYTEMLADGEANDEKTRKEFYLVIQNQAQRLNRLIEDILNISRIESGLIKIEKKPISLTILIEEQLQMIKSYAEEKNIKLVSQKPIVYDQVFADKDMIAQVIVNLLSNAIKYTKAGGSVKIEAEVDEIASLARVKVTDSGVGIPSEDIEHVFDKFYRVDANKKQAKGTGLGLNLVKQIIEKVHNGRVFVTSQVGKGSTFGFELPLAVNQKVEAV